MVIENPERMGFRSCISCADGWSRQPSLSLHPALRQPAIGSRQNPSQVMRDSQDGFYIAEKDLELRGPGDLLGTRQTGEQQFRIADLAVHAHMIPDR